MPVSDFCMPSLGADMEWGILAEWYVEPGDRVERGQIVGVVETRKGAIEVEIFETGVVDELVVEPGTKVPVGEPLARIRTEETAAEEEERVPPEEGAVEERAPPEEAEPVPAETAVEARKPGGEEKEPTAAEAEPEGGPGEEERIRATPAARRRAAELGLELSRVRATGSHGTVVLEDVEAAEAPGGAEPSGAAEAHEGPEPVGAGEAPGKAPAREARPEGAPARRAPTEEERAAMREAVAAAMSRSKREIPHYYLATHIDVTEVVRWLEEENETRPTSERLLPAAVLLKATAGELRDHPELNGFWTDDGFEPSDDINIGVGISLRGSGLVAPALHHVDRKDVARISRELLDLVNRARGGRLRSSEVTDATVTVTNLGERGVETVYGIIYPPQVALVGFGRIVERPWAVDGALDVRRVVHATLAGDHRASDGHLGGLFLASLEERVQRPREL